MLDNHLEQDTASDAVEAAKQEGIQLSTYLVKNKIVQPSVIATVSSQEFGLPVFDLE